MKLPLVLPRKPLLAGTAALLLAMAGYTAWLGSVITAQFEQRRWNAPAAVYAAPLELYRGLAMTAVELTGELRRLGYRESAELGRGGTFRRSRGGVELVTRRFRFEDGPQPALRLEVGFEGGRIERLTDGNERAVALARLDPLRIGSIFPSHGEDRIIVRPHEIPPLLVDALKAVEDRRFDEHHGIDLTGILRAASVNLRAGGIEQGGSTLTQQLVKNYFLSPERSFLRKVREAAMAIVLELRYEKDDILTAYVNEVYLGQDGARAIHGFGLASQYYFDKRLEELELHEIALLVGALRGPAIYDPRHRPARARERRDLVLAVLAERGVVPAGESAEARTLDLGVVDRRSRYTAYHPAYMALVRRQLREQYPERELATQSLRVFTALDPAVQAQAEEALADGLARLERARPLPEGVLEGAVVVTHPQNAEVIALVGGRRSGFDGFNRALDARRPAGSLVKPAVFLAALEQGYSLADAVDDEPIEVPLETGETWTPANYDDETHGRVSLFRALTESFNMATVRLGMEVGVARIARLLGRLGLAETPPAYPSLLLGAVEASPIEIAQLYNSLANDGFRVPLRAVRAVTDRDGELIARYPLEIAEASDPASVYQLNQALVQVLERGTGRSARQWLPATLTAAGKTGTSEDFRDSWFAGFTGSHLAVVWIGADDNRPTGLTGATGALTVWAPLVAGLRGAAAYRPPMPPSLEEVTVEYASGLVADGRCADVVAIAVSENTELAVKPGCGPGLRRFGNRVKEWFEGVMN